jgi:hypothetical protein
MRPMTTHCTTYPTTHYTTYPTPLAARHAIDALLVGGLPAHDVRLLTGRAPRDVRREPAGGFAGPIGPDAPVGTYGGTTVERHRGAGAFAGDPDGQRQGSVADTDRVATTSYGDGRTRVTGLRGARRLLSRTGLDDSCVEAAIAELHRGRSVSVAKRSGRDANQPSDATGDSLVSRAA